MSNVQFAVGDKVRSYDFQPMEGRGDCYMEGVVTAVYPANGLLVVKTTAQVFDNRVIEDFASEFQTALPGKLFFGEWDGRVTKVN